MKSTFLAIFLVASNLAYSQKKIIDHTTYDEWKSVKSEVISDNGKFIAYVVNPHKGDGYLYVYDVEKEQLDSIPRGKNPHFNGTSEYLAFSIAPGYDTLRNCELKKVKKKKWPKDSLGIYMLSSNSLEKFERVSSFKMADEGRWLAFMSADNEEKKAEPEEPKRKKKKKKKRKKKGTEEPKYTSKGHLLTVMNPLDGEKKQFKDVRSYIFSEHGNVIAFDIHKKYDQDSSYLSIFDCRSMKVLESDAHFVDIANLAFNDQETQLVYMASNDTIKEKRYDLQMIGVTNGNIRLIADSTSAFFEEGHGPSTDFSPSFTKDGSILYFGARELPKIEPEDTLLDSEKAKLDIWHYQDQRLQPQQLVELKGDQKQTNLFAYHVKTSQAIQLSNDTLRVRNQYDLKGDYLMGVSTEAYAHTYNWVIPYPQDDYRVSVKTGKTELLRRANTHSGRLSPSGKYYIYYNIDKHNYFARNADSQTETCISCKIDNVNWEADVNGMPMDAWTLGVIGWKEGEQKVYLQSEFDIWEYDFASDTPSCISQELGSENTIEIRPERWSRDSVYVDFENVYATGFDRKTKGTHVYQLKDHGDHVDILEMSYHNASIYGSDRSKDGSQVVMRTMTAKKYPDIYLASNELKPEKRISHVNPQQSEYNWTDVELVKWKSYDGVDLEGLLYKPENYDASKEYPLMVYFYELYSDRFHQHYVPKPTASIVYPTEYASAGYLVFIPDIRYKEGHPGKSAYDCIMSGTDKILELYPNVDSTRMALQGQSWGGYQTAQLITMTDRYKAAMAGAPVSNMFSAYGGIRWGSGLNRQFQYERTQSRIGHTIWETPELYVENSPLFHLPNVKTPLLIMHNDGDGAVPWYQGIELFTGMKRLGKSVWMLNYNDEEHNLMKDANRRDLSRRMRQFFDHYMLNMTAPKWMSEGVPATKKGKDYGWE